MPDAAITTDIIAGFPGETPDEFQESLDFVQEMDFAGGHVFSYSVRPGTAAARMSAQLPLDVKKRRNALLRAALERSAAVYRQRFVGRQTEVLWESTTQLDEAGWRMAGLTGNYLRVEALAPRPMWNEISRVLLQRPRGDALVGVIPA
jgi:threonylcarbamoyladenosine tRNA methylthiotransferase MtaB